MKKGFLSVCLILIFFSGYLMAQQSRLSKQRRLSQKIKEIIKPAKGIVGVSILGLESRNTLSVNGDAHLVMHSIMKFPIALTVLHWVDSGKLTLNQMIHVKKIDLPKTYSPLRDKYPDGNVDVSVSELLSYMVSLSDNDACNNPGFSFFTVEVSRKNPAAKVAGVKAGSRRQACYGATDQF